MKQSDEEGYPGINTEELEKVIKEVFEKEDKGLKNIVLYRGCSTRGYMQVRGIGSIHCGNEECTSCNKFAEEFHKAMEEEVKKYNRDGYK